jgi:hypothetical protein
MSRTSSALLAVVLTWLFSGCAASEEPLDLATGVVTKSPPPPRALPVLSGRPSLAYPRTLRPPTADKAESKLWFQDGRWWGVLYDANKRGLYIHRFEAGSQVWSNTGTLVESRYHARTDALWDGRKLFLASGTTYVSNFGHPPTEAAVRSGSAEVRRYSYDRQRSTYSLDAGFPVTVRRGSSESLTLAEDSTGRLWVTFTQHGQVWVNASTTAQTVWGQPFRLPDPAAVADADDISDVVAFGGNRIGVLWSNQRDRRFYLGVHADTDPVSSWRFETAYGGGVNDCSAGCANDHMSVKAAADGTLFAAVKTATRLPGQPFTVLLVRKDTGWSNYPVSTSDELSTRPMVLLDEEHRQLYLFTVFPEIGGEIRYQATSMDSPRFSRGLGTIFMKGGLAINNPTSTKQSVSSASGLLVLASDEPSGRYWQTFTRLP